MNHHLLQDNRLRLLEAAARDVATMELPDEFTAEAAGRVNKVARELQDVKRSWLAEAGPTPSTGSGGYKIGVSNKCVRTYNTARNVHDLAQADGLTYAQELDALIREGVLKIEWAWQKLQKAFRERDVSMVIAAHEVSDDGDLDAAHVGEVWTSTNTIEGVTE